DLVTVPRREIRGRYRRRLRRRLAPAARDHFEDQAGGIGEDKVAVALHPGVAARRLAQVELLIVNDRHRSGAGRQDLARRPAAVARLVRAVGTAWPWRRRGRTGGELGEGRALIAGGRGLGEAGERPKQPADH